MYSKHKDSSNLIIVEIPLTNKNDFGMMKMN